LFYLCALQPHNLFFTVFIYWYSRFGET
jgi:hypothetical protein